MTLKKYLRSTLAVIVIVIALALIIFRFAFGGSFRVIETGSMVPTLPVHTIALYVPAKDVHVDDIVAVQQPGMSIPITHRLVDINKDGSIVTKGDANSSADNPDVPFQKSDIIAKEVFQIPILSSSFWLSIPGILLGVVIVLFLLFAFGPTIKRGDDEDEQMQSDKDRELART